MADALKVNQTMTQIDLRGTCWSGNGVDTWEWTDMARAFLVNRIGAKGAWTMARALEINQTVVQLDLSGKCSCTGVGKTK